MVRTGIERAAPVRTLVQKQSGGLFLARGRFHWSQNAAGRLGAATNPSLYKGENANDSLLQCPVCALPSARLRCTPTAATRSPPFFRHRRRSGRSPYGSLYRHLPRQLGNSPTGKLPLYSFSPFLYNHSIKTTFEDGLWNDF